MYLSVASVEGGKHIEAHNRAIVPTARSLMISGLNLGKDEHIEERVSNQDSWGTLVIIKYILDYAISFLNRERRPYSPV